MKQLNDFMTRINLDTVRDFCIANGTTAEYVKGELFTCAGQAAHNVGFIKSGYFKYCVVTSTGEYAVTGFSFAGECVMDFTQSFLFGKPSKTSIIAGCDSEVVQMPLRPVREFVQQHNPELIGNISAVLLEEAYSRYLNIYKKSPTERYLELIDENPGILDKVTLRDIASYLLVTPVYLSRIRRKTGRY